MKLNEIITESQLQEGPLLNKLGSAVGKGVGTLAKGAGAVAGGIAGIGSAFKKGFSAGRGTVAAAGDEPDAAAPTASAQPAADTGAQTKAAAAPAATSKSAAPTAQAQPAAPAPKAVQPAAEKPAAADQTASAATVQSKQSSANDTLYAQTQKAIAALKPEEQKQILTALQTDPKVKAAMAKAPAAQSQASNDMDGISDDDIAKTFAKQDDAKLQQTVATGANEKFKAAAQKELDRRAKTPKGRVAPSQAEIDADRARIMGPTSDSVIRTGSSIVESIDEAGLMAKLGTKVGQAAQAAGHVAGAAARGSDIAKNDPEHAAAMVRAFKTGQTEPVQQAAAKIQDPSGTVPAPIIDKLNQLTLEQRAELHKLLVQKTA